MVPISFVLSPVNSPPHLALISANYSRLYDMGPSLLSETLLHTLLPTLKTCFNSTDEMHGGVYEQWHALRVGEYNRGLNEEVMWLDITHKSEQHFTFTVKGGSNSHYHLDFTELKSHFAWSRQLYGIRKGIDVKKLTRAVTGIEYDYDGFLSMVVDTFDFLVEKEIALHNIHSLLLDPTPLFCQQIQAPIWEFKFSSTAMNITIQGNSTLHHITNTENLKLDRIRTVVNYLFTRLDTKSKSNYLDLHSLHFNPFHPHSSSFIPQAQLTATWVPKLPITTTTFTSALTFTFTSTTAHRKKGKEKREMQPLDAAQKVRLRRAEHSVFLPYPHHACYENSSTSVDAERLVDIQASHLAAI
ncbi:uncharacterized protein BDR25DRAFT_361973 [Lindgomyces ingoldianus]|uniref:Uncharacterized protein n=1 Tax=Lindgomyces ingoldianus TaxID=673940 RepID=A0ACB6QD18_9PLEO|nr:uncharacterized protein BDR25DRAFT_361973 [Lindgomyces ingoldianus]KAF2464046.1 hypothetical protein BDR25DRAFT_361973 [Lindgomyces ingoldianus]